MSKHPEREDRQRRSRAPREPEGAALAGHRHERLTRILREEIGAVLRDEVADGRLDGVAITIVELSVDYKNARIGFVGPAATRADRERLERLLERATPFLRRRLADAVDLKAVPALRFVWDAYAAPGSAG